MKPEVDAGPGSPPLRLVTAPGPPLGAIFGGIGLAAAAAVRLVGLDRLPLTLCVFKGLTGLPCPTCGSTRALGRLFGLDVAGAFAMNPFTTVLAAIVATWAVADAALLPRGVAVGVSASKTAGFAIRVGALLLFLANWVYLLADGR